MTGTQRLLAAVRERRVWRAIGLRARQFTYANSHPDDHYLKAGRHLLRRLAEQPVSFNIDVVSTCNLVCPTCPVANWPQASWTGVKGIMDEALLHQLIRKAIGECVVADVRLFAYTEPLLHPRLPELITVVKSYGLPCHISTNLNVMRDAEALLRAKPDTIMVSVSGFRQETYGVTHAGGDIDLVKTHMRALADARTRLGSKTILTVSFHKYRTNLDDLPRMKAFAESLGFGFADCWASFFPLEKVLTYAKPDLALAELTPTDLGIIDRLGISLREAVETASRTPVDTCVLHDSAVILDVAGNVYLCCESAMDATRNKIASFLDAPLALVQARKKNHPLCTTCMSSGLPMLAAPK